MNTSIAWLNQYLDRPIDAQEAQALLTRLGFPVESMETVARPGSDDDVCLDVEITSNRGDALSHIGLAREIAAGSDRRLLLPADDLPDTDAESVDALTRVDHEAAGLCPVYTARVIRGVTVGPSPAWLVERLEAVGLRSVNNVVDITNFVLLETGQPLHAFDLARLHEQRIVVRRAKPGETFTAIDHSEHKLQGDMLVIADGDRPVAVAGVMGGLDSEVGESTRDVLLESARFDPLSVRRTSRALKLSSDSSYRFERGVDPCGVERASRRAAQLIVELAGGELAAGVIRAGEPPPQPTSLTLRAARCSQLLGVDLPADDQARLLEALGLQPAVQDDVLHCTIPTWRLDLAREVDLIEEVARLHGLDEIPVEDRLSLTIRRPQEQVRARDVLAATLVAHGYHETITPSFLAEPQAQPFVQPPGAALIALADQGKRAESTLRPSVLPSLMVCRKANQDAGNDHVKLFETASVWWQTDENEPLHEKRVLALLADAQDGEAALRDLRGALTELVERLGGTAGLDQLTIQACEAPPSLKIAARVGLGQTPIGQYGLASDAMVDRFNLQTPLALADLDLAPLLELYPPARQVADLPRFPGIERDLSIVVDESVTWARIQDTIHALHLDKLEQLDFVTVYRGKPIDKGSKSVSLRLLFRDPQTTLRHDEVDPQVAKAVDALNQSLGATLRA